MASKYAASPRRLCFILPAVIILRSSIAVRMQDQDAASEDASSGTSEALDEGRGETPKLRGALHGRRRRPEAQASRSMEGTPQEGTKRRRKTMFQKPAFKPEKAEAGVPTFSVLTFNLWGKPREKDKAKVLSKERIQKAMQILNEEVTQFNPTVIAFQEYSSAHFDPYLESLWKEYSGCRMPVTKKSSEASTDKSAKASSDKSAKASTDQSADSSVKIGVKKGVRCRVQHAEPFSLKCPGCDKYSRHYQAVQIRAGQSWITIAALHLMSGQGPKVSECKKQSLERSFKLATGAKFPSIVMGDMNWFNLEGSVEVEIPIETLIGSDKYADAASLERGATFPAWDPDIVNNPSDRFAAKLDRVFHSTDLQSLGYRIINRPLDPNALTEDGMPDKYNFISDHVGSFVFFQVPTKKIRRSLQQRWKSMRQRKALLGSAQLLKDSVTGPGSLTRAMTSKTRGSLRP